MIRPATPADADAVTSVAQAAFERYVPRIGRPPVPMLLDYAEAIGAAKVWVATEDGTIVGFVLLEDQPDALLLDVLAVAPSTQGKGIGAALLDFTEDQARLRGYQRIVLYTHETMTENLSYYPHHGYTETGRETVQNHNRVFFQKRL